MFERRCYGQDKPATVAEAFRRAILSLFKRDDLDFKNQYFHWAGFMLHGFGDVELDPALVDTISSYLTKNKLITATGDVCLKQFTDYWKENLVEAKKEIFNDDKLDVASDPSFDNLSI